MGVRTITVTDAAYERLAAMKRPGESFTDVILRVTRKRSLLRFSELISTAEAASLAEAALRARDERRDVGRRAR